MKHHGPKVAKPVLQTPSQAAFAVLETRIPWFKATPGRALETLERGILTTVSVGSNFQVHR